MLGLKSRLKGVMLFCIIMGVIACVQTQQTQVFKPKYSPIYYITKAPKDSDKRFFEKLIKYGDKDEKVDGKILLGGYYYKLGKDDKAISLLEGESSNNETVEYARLLWLFDIYLKQGKREKIDEFFAKLLKMKNEANLSGIICNKYKINLRGNSCLIALYNKKFVKKEKRKESVQISDNASEKVEKDVTNEMIESEKTIDNATATSEEAEKSLFQDNKICLDDKSFDTNEVKGMFYNIKTNKLDYNIEIDDNCTGRWYFNSDNDVLLDKNHLEKITFAVDYQEMFREIADFLDLQNTDGFYLITDEDIASDKVIKKVSANKNALKHFFIGFNDEAKEDGKYYFVYVGNSEKSFKVVPLIKYFAKNPDAIKVVVGTDMFVKDYLETDFYEYFRNAVVVAPVCEICDDLHKEFFKGIEDFYGSKSDFKSAIGYDVISFINNEVDSGIHTDFVSGIKGIKNDRVYRTFNFYKIISNKRLKLLVN